MYPSEGGSGPTRSTWSDEKRESGTGHQRRMDVAGYLRRRAIRAFAGQAQDLCPHPRPDKTPGNLTESCAATGRREAVDTVKDLADGGGRDDRTRGNLADITPETKLGAGNLDPGKLERRIGRWESRFSSLQCSEIGKIDPRAEA